MLEDYDFILNKLVNRNADQGERCTEMFQGFEEDFVEGISKAVVRWPTVVVCAPLFCRRKEMDLQPQMACRVHGWRMVCNDEG